MLSEPQQTTLKLWRQNAGVEDRRLAALEMIADQLAAIDGRLFQIQGLVRFKK